MHYRSLDRQLFRLGRRPYDLSFDPVLMAREPRTMTEKWLLKASVCAFMIAKDMRVMVAGKSIWEITLQVNLG